MRHFQVTPGRTLKRRPSCGRVGISSWWNIHSSWSWSYFNLLITAKIVTVVCDLRLHQMEKVTFGTANNFNNFNFNCNDVDLRAPKS